MDKRSKRYFGYGIIVAFLIAVIFLAYIYWKAGGLSIGISVPIIIGTCAGIVASYVMYQSFLQRDRHITFAPDEEVILKRKFPNKSVIIHQIIGHGDSPHSSPAEVNLYLTNMGIVAEPPGSGEPVLYIPFRYIQELQTINRMLLKYVRVRYIDIYGMADEVLLYVGDETDVWAEHIGRNMLGNI
jgi:hypothetical protein